MSRREIGAYPFADDRKAPLSTPVGLSVESDWSWRNRIETVFVLDETSFGLEL